jgi:hypothetical protein
LQSLVTAYVVANILLDFHPWANVLYHQGKLVGKMETEETLIVGENELTFVAQLKQPTVQIDRASRGKD